MQNHENGVFSPFGSEEQEIKIERASIREQVPEHSSKRKRIFDEEYTKDGNKETSTAEYGEEKQMEYDLDPDIGAKVLEFQKKAIWCQMLQYKRLHVRDSEEIAKWKSTEEKYTAASSIFVTYLDRIEVLLEDICNSIPGIKQGIDYGKKDISSISCILEVIESFDLMKLDNVLTEKFAILQNMISGIISAVSANGVQLREGIYGKESEWKQNLANNVELNLTHISLNRFRNMVNVLQTDLEKTRDELSHTQKKLDMRNLSNVLPDKTASVEEPSPPSNNSNTSLKSIASAYEAERNLSKLRLLEIDKLKSDKHRLLSELSALNAKLNSSINKDTTNFDRDVQKSFPDLKYLSKENSILKSKLEEAQSQIDELKQWRRSFADRLHKEELERRAVLESHIKKANQNLQRVRANRDYLQHSLNLRISTNENEIASKQKLTALVKSNEDRIVSLLDELRTCRLIVAGAKGDNKLYELFALYVPDHDLASKLETQINDYLDTINKLKLDIQILQKKLSPQPPSSPNQHQNYVDTLTTKLSELEQSLSHVKTKYELSEKTQQKLLSEIEKLGEAWCELDKQNRENVMDISSLRESLIKYTADKSKLEQKNVLLTKHVVAQSGQIKVLKSKSLKQDELLELSRREEKILVSQLSNIEKELALTKNDSHKYQLNAGDLLFQVSQLESSEKELKSKCSSLLSQLKEKAALYEEARERYKKLNSERSHLLREIDVLRKSVPVNDNTDDANLKKELEEYKFLLKCSSCNTRFKSHVLLKCMHTFCRECIEETWNTRQRKCPSCGVNFSKQDSRQIYL